MIKKYYVLCARSLTSTLIQRIFASTHSDLEVLGVKVSTQQTAQCASFIFPLVKHQQIKLLHSRDSSAYFYFHCHPLLSSGITAECQQTRSQLQNRDTAMRMLRARLYQSMMGKETEQRHTARKQQVSEHLRYFYLKNVCNIHRHLSFLTTS